MDNKRATKSWSLFEEMTFWSFSGTQVKNYIKQNRQSDARNRNWKMDAGNVRPDTGKWSPKLEKEGPKAGNRTPEAANGHRFQEDSIYKYSPMIVRSTTGGPIFVSPDKSRGDVTDVTDLSTVTV